MKSLKLNLPFQNVDENLNEDDTAEENRAAQQPEMVTVTSMPMVSSVLSTHNDKLGHTFCIL